MMFQGQVESYKSWDKSRKSLEQSQNESTEFMKICRFINHKFRKVKDSFLTPHKIFTKNAAINHSIL
jgi:hypothetical protein